MSTTEQLQKIIDTSKNIVFFGGAGVSTESGIPDFRSADGLYYEEWKFPPETIISRSFFDSNTAEFYRFYRAKMIAPDAKPNAAHLKLAELEKAGKLSAIVTQNIDGLHQIAGSKNVLELHGSIHRNYCLRCGAFYDASFILDSDDIPLCTRQMQDIPGLFGRTCGATVKPYVVLYEEGLDNEVVNGAIEAISVADTLIIGGTSLVVYPAASLIQYFKGKALVLINKSETSADDCAVLVIHENIGEVFAQIRV